MVTMHWIDWAIVIASMLVCFVPALFFARRSGRSAVEFFGSGRAVPWWLAGLSMVATTFSSDTPNLVTDIVRTQGVAGNWCWWAFLLTGMATVFFYSRLWRRSGVLTDLEFYEVRYSGKAASFVRGFRSVYLGLFFNCFIMATVCMAACKIAAMMFGLPYWQTLLLVCALNCLFAAHSGLWGVLVIDMIQFFIMMVAVVAAAYFAVEHVGGLSVMVEKLNNTPGPGGLNYLNMLPDFTNWDLAVSIFIIPLAVNWWATWYPGGEPGGGSYMAQRMLASKTEKDALKAVLFFNVAHIVLRPWPWILVALASILVFPTLGDLAAANPHVPLGSINHDIAYPAMMKLLPFGFIGLMVGGLIAANSSTLLTHLNWGASYLVHDCYRRFIKTNAEERHYVWVGRLVTVGLFVVAATMVFFLESAKEAFDIIMLIGAGTGLLYLLRWFWWRINAWCEVTAMVVSFVLSIGLIVLHRFDVVHRAAADGCTACAKLAVASPDAISTMPHVPQHWALILTVIVTTVSWLIAAYFAPQTSQEQLVAFYKKVRPFGPGWERIRVASGLSKEEANITQENIPMALLGWLAGVIMVLSALFCIGNFLYGRTALGVSLGVLCIAAVTVVGYVLNKLWSAPSEKQ